MNRPSLPWAMAMAAAWSCGPASAFAPTTRAPLRIRERRTPPSNSNGARDDAPVAIGRREMAMAAAWSCGPASAFPPTTRAPLRIRERRTPPSNSNGARDDAPVAIGRRMVALPDLPNLPDDLGALGAVAEGLGVSARVLARDTAAWSASHPLPALAASSLLAYSAASSAVGGGSRPSKPYPSGRYDADAAGRYFDGRSLKVARRALEVAAVGVGFGLSRQCYRNAAADDAR